MPASMPETRACLVRLVRLGHATPRGQGWTAGYDLDEGWLDSQRRILQGLQQAEQKAFALVGHRLAAWTTTLSKKALASGDLMSATI